MNEHDLLMTRFDLERILTALTPAEINHMLRNVRTGRVNGNQYVPDDEDGENGCGCLVGAVIEARGLDLSGDELDTHTLTQRLGFHVSVYSQIERYLFPVEPGDTPATSPELANVERWIVEYQERQAVQS